MVDRHVAEQRLIEEEVAVTGAEIEVEVEIAGDQIAQRAPVQKAPGESGGGNQR